jgi:hypothetical protein
MATSTLGNGTLVLAGTTSGTTTVTATAVAGTTTLTLPAATDTLVGKATTDTLTNKTLTGAAMNGTLGATTPSTASVTTLTTSSTITHNGGTANGVAYLNGSKVLTTGSALVFDGTNVGVGVTPTGWSGLTAIQIGQAASLFAQSGGDYIGGYVGSNIYYNAGWKYIRNGYATKYDFNESNNGQHRWWIAPNNTSGAGAAATETQAMTLDASGNLGVGTTSPSTRLHLKGASGTTTLRLEPSSSTSIYTQVRGANGDLYLEADPGNAEGSSSMLFTVDGTERARIDSSGNLLVGTTSSAITTAGILLKPAGNSASVPLVGSSGASSSSSEITMAVYSTTAAQYQFYVAYNGQATGRFTYATFSDARLKTNISSIQNGLATITALNPVTFNFLPAKDQTENSDLKYGFIAQEVQQLLPTLVNEGLDKAEDETPYLTLQTGDLLPIAIKAIQEQQALITTLTARITALESA